MPVQRLLEDLGQLDTRTVAFGLSPSPRASVRGRRMVASKTALASPQQRQQPQNGRSNLVTESGVISPEMWVQYRASSTNTPHHDMRSHSLLQARQIRVKVKSHNAAALRRPEVLGSVSVRKPPSITRNYGGVLLVASR